MATQVAAGVAVPGEQGHLPREEPAGQRRGRPGRSPWEGREDGEVGIGGILPVIGELISPL